MYGTSEHEAEGRSWQRRVLNCWRRSGHIHDQHRTSENVPAERLLKEFEDATVHFTAHEPLTCRLKAGS